jgi:hypothetical protein
MMLSSFQFHLIMALLSCLFYVYFRGVGVAATIATAFLLQTLVVAEKQRNWKKLNPFFHALWLTQILVVGILYILSPNDLIASASRLVGEMTFISSPFDRIAEAAIMFPEAIPTTYKSALQMEFFRIFFPAAQLASVVGGPFFGLALASMMQLAETAKPGTTRKHRILVSTMFSGIFSFGWALVSFFDFAVLPTRGGTFGPVMPVVVSAIYWAWPLFIAFAFLLWKQAYSRRF